MGRGMFKGSNLIPFIPPLPTIPDSPSRLPGLSHSALEGGEFPTSNFIVDSLWHWHYSEVGKSGWLWWRRVSSGS
jgi:hypothetical protein